MSGKKAFFSIFALSLFFLISSYFNYVYAADIRADNYVSIRGKENNFSDLYLFGQNISVDAPVDNDLVAAGGNVILDGRVSGNVLAAGGDLQIKGVSDGSVRIAGGNLLVEGNVGRDLVAGGGKIVIAKSAIINGDLIVAGGDVEINGSVNGKAIINGGKVLLNGPVKRQVEGHIGKLTLGRDATIGENLVYSSGEKATVEGGARVMGQTRFTQIKEPKKAADEARAFITGFSIYKLIVDVILTVGIIYFLGAFLRLIFSRISKSPLLSGVGGFGFLVLMPALSFVLLTLLWLGVGSFLFYLLVLLTAAYSAKAFAGWLVLKWWYKRDKKVYVLDWKAGIVGPLVLFLIALIPVLGWLVVAAVYIVSLGALLWEFGAAVKLQNLNSRKK